MAILPKSESRTLTSRQRKGRTVNAVVEMLRKRLSVPNIYIEPSSSLIAADVLAVDRAGSGDLHAVVVELSDVAAILDAKQWMLTNVKARIQQLTSLPAHYRYLAIPQNLRDLLVRGLGPHLYSEDGIGRIGIISIMERGEEPPVAELLITPERFRVDAAKLSKIEKNLINNKKVRPDIEVRI